MIDRLRNLIENTNSRVLGQVLKSKINTDIFNWVMTESKILDRFDSTIKERVYFILNGKPDILCDNNKKKTFNAKKNNYGFCDNISKCICLKQHQKETYTHRDMKVVIEKRKDTWIKKYGVENVSSLKTVKDKRKETMLKKDYSYIRNKLAYEKETIGYEQVINRVKDIVTPLFNRDEYNGSNRSNVYLWECNTCSTTFKSHIDYGTIPKCIICYPHTISLNERKIADFIRSLGFNIITNTKSIIHPLELDIYIPEKNIAIEYNGIYWHSSDMKPNNYHVNKYLECKKLGIKLIHIFEDEWGTKSEIIKNRLLNILGKSEKLYARKGMIKEISSVEYKEFTEKFHLRGYAHATIKYGLYIDNILSAVMGFSKSRYTDTGFELIRFCSKNTIVGGAGKLFKHFIKLHSPDTIVSYADRCWSDGEVYLRLGFTDETININNIGYWYIKNNIRYHRSNFTKNKLIKLGHNSELSENEIMKSMGYIKIYDCGNHKFVWKNKH